MTNFQEELEPCEQFRILLENNFIDYESCPTPKFLVVNSVDEACSRINFTDVDYTLISMASPDEIKMRGNWQYFDRSVTLLLSSITQVSRQRVWNIDKELRSIILINKYLFPGWRLMIPVSSGELAVEENLNLWRYSFLVTLSNPAVLADTVV